MIGETNKAFDMWLASPSSYSLSSLMRIDYKGIVEYGNHSVTINGFRPLVCLNTNIKLEEQENGIYLIK